MILTGFIAAGLLILGLRVYYRSYIRIQWEDRLDAEKCGGSYFKWRKKETTSWR